MTSSFSTNTVYTWGYYKELNPLYLNYVCALNGHQPVLIEDGFNYCELGCGYGVTTNGLAELFPQGEFFGIDYNKDHIDAATQMAEDIGLSNIRFQALDFNIIESAGLPQFDFIILHGVFSWVDPSTRESIVKFIATNLKEDGVVYLSYSAMPGWSAMASLRDIVLTHTADMTTDDIVKAQAGLDYLDFMASNNAAFFRDNPPAKEFLTEIQSKHINYVAHELLVDFSKPSYFHDVATEMNSVNLCFSGSAILHLNFIDLAAPPEFRNILEKVKTRDEFESRGDFIRNQRFRKDVFKKSQKTMSAEEQLQVLSHIVFDMTCTVDDFRTTVAFGDVELNYTGDIFSNLIQNLADKPNSAANLITMDEFRACPVELIVDALKFLSAGEQVIPLQARTEKQGELDLEANRYTLTSNFNIQLLKRRLLKQDAIVLIAPKAGIGIEMSMADALFTLCLVEAKRDQVNDWVIQRLTEAKQEIAFSIDTEKNAVALAVQKFRKTRLPKFLELGILEPAN
jgi:SAM-dependent methyltransferase